MDEKIRKRIMSRINDPEGQKYLLGEPHGDLTNAKREHFKKMKWDVTEQEILDAPDSVLLIAVNQILTDQDIVDGLALAAWLNE